MNAVTACIACMGLAFAVLAAPIATSQGDSSRRVVTTASSDEAMKVTVTGTIEAVGQDAAGHATAVRITDANGGRFLIAQVGKGKELLAHVGKSATVTGRLLSEAPRVLEVETFRLRQG